MSQDFMEGYKLPKEEPTGSISALAARGHSSPPRLPFPIGTIVYHKCQTAEGGKNPGIVTHYLVGERDFSVAVTWGNGLQCDYYKWFELTEEYEPDYGAPQEEPADYARR
jgi:hypothetical protein